LTVIALFVAEFALNAVQADTRLADAAKRQDAATLQALVKQKTDVNAAQPDGMTALLWSAYWGDEPSVALLLAAGAQVNVANRYGVTPAWAAAARGDEPGERILTRLLKAGADAKYANADGKTLLMVAASAGRPDVMRELLSRGAEVNAREKNLDQTALMFAAAERHPDVVKVLLETGADATLASASAKLSPDRPPAGGGIFYNQGTNGGLTALLFSAREGDIDSSRLLIEAGASINQPDPRGITPLQLAIQNGHFDLAMVLINKGASVNDGSLTAATDLHSYKQAASRPAPKHVTKATLLDVISELLAHGADPNAVNGKPSPWSGSRAIATVSALHRAAQAADPEVVELLLAAKGDPNRFFGPPAPDPSDPTAGVGNPLAGRGRGGAAPPSNALAAVLQGGGGIVGGRFATDDYPFRLVKADDKAQTMRRLIAHGADVNRANPQGTTPLHIAAQQGSVELASLLLEAGANPSVKNGQGLTPLDLAEGKGGNAGGGPGRRGGGGAPPNDELVELLKASMARVQNQ
jgi:ankyrin repeat protein